MNATDSTNAPTDGDGWPRALDAVVAWLDSGGGADQLDVLYSSIEPELHPRVARVLDAFAAIAFDGADAPTRAELRERLLERVRAQDAADGEVQVWRRWDDGGDANALIRDASEGPFEKTSIPGIEVRRLFVDRAADRVSMLVRMAPGTSYPRHRHGGAEECFVLSGDLHHGDRVMRAGDFEVVDRGSVHDTQWTEGGCLLFLRSSLHDEILAA